MATSEVFLTTLRRAPVEAYPPEDDNDDQISVTSSTRSDDVEDAGDTKNVNVIKTVAYEDDADHRNGAAETASTDLQTWLEGNVHESDEYDTDLEEDFPPGWYLGMGIRTYRHW
jgi:hypothetical protein